MLSAANNRRVTKYDRVLGGYLGVAVGDALGATLELLSRNDVVERYGKKGLTEIVGGGWLSLLPGDVTDDTAMTLAVARGLRAATTGEKKPNWTLARDFVGRHFIDWLQTDPPDVGATVRTALQAYLRCRDWDATEAIVWEQYGRKSAGNGALMRTLPVTFFVDDPVELVFVSRLLTKMTHPAPIAQLVSALYNMMAKYLLLGHSIALAWQSAQNDVRFLAPDLFDDPEVESTLNHLNGAASASETDVYPGGYCVDTIHAALWALGTTQSAKEAIVKAANLGGDADTVAAVTGGLAGVYYGAKAIPESWAGKLPETYRDEFRLLAQCVSP